MGGNCLRPAVWEPQAFLHSDVGPWPGVWSDCVSAWVRKSPPETGVAGGVQQGHSTLHGASAPFWAPHSARVWKACVCPQFDCAVRGACVRGGTAEPGPLGPSRRRWLGSAQFPGPGFPLTPPGRRGLPTSAPLPPAPPPAPRNVPLHPSPPPRGQAPGGCRSPASSSWEPGRGRLGQDAWVPPPFSSQGEIPLRSPQALGSQNNPAGEGRLWREGSGRGRRTELRGAAGASGERTGGEERAHGEGDWDTDHPRGVPRPSRGSRGGPEASWPVHFPTGGLHHPGPDRLTPGRGRGGTTPPLPSRGRARPAPFLPSGPLRWPAPTPALPLSLRTGVRSEPRGRLPERSSAEPTRAGGHGGDPGPGQGLHGGGAAPWLHRSLW